MAQVILLMGGNIGDTTMLLGQAVKLLAAKVGRMVSCSTLLETEPWGFSDGVNVVAKFINQAVWIETDLLPEALLEVVQRVETEVGRERGQEQEEREARGERYASRKIDIDIIFYDDIVFQSERLTIPHPLMQEREFVLRPMVEIAAEWRHPLLGKSCQELLNELKNRDI